MDSGAGCKVDRAVATFALADADPRYGDIHEGLVCRWKGDDGRSAMGYRPLTDWFNERVIRAALEDAGADAFGPRLSYLRETLQDGDEIEREELHERLEAKGVSARSLSDALVSWGTMRTHLQDCLEAEKPTESAGAWERDAIDRAEEFAASKVESAVSSLASKDEFATGDNATVAVQFQLACTECPTRTPLEIALDRGYVCQRHSDG